MLENQKLWTEDKNMLDYLKAELDQMSASELEDAFYKELEFGTAGLRGIVGAGTNRMNPYTVFKATQGYIKYLLNDVENAKEKGVAIAFDCRHFSKEFAWQVSKQIANAGIKVYLFERLRPTPQLAYTVREKGCAGGIVITASHNPPKYNGYKIYNELGCQLSTEQANQVASYINEVGNPLTSFIDVDDNFANRHLITILTEKDDEPFILEMLAQLSRPNEKKDVRVVYTPFHGTGGELMPKLLQRAGFENAAFVEAQMTIDPNFSTVKSPNPEEPTSFAMAIDLAKDFEADVILGADPDADRMGVYVLHQSEYVFLTGNQIGALLLDYIINTQKEQNRLVSNSLFVSTIVSSPFAFAIARANGVQTVETFTGFKNIGREMNERPQLKPIFGYEESFGYMVSENLRDKDSFGVMLVFLEMVNHYALSNKTAIDRLNELYEQYGYYYDQTVSLTLEGIEGISRIGRIIEYFRTNPIVNLAGNECSKYEDYLLLKSYTNDTQEDLTGFESANVLKFFFGQDMWIAMRPSGTEPKCKFYFNVQAENRELALSQFNAINKELFSIVETIK